MKNVHLKSSCQLMDSMDRNILISNCKQSTSKQTKCVDYLSKVNCYLPIYLLKYERIYIVSGIWPN